MGNHYSSCEFNVVSYGTQRCVGIVFVVIGKQQWGDIVDGTNTFTVAFTSFCKIANAGNYSWGGVDNIIRSIELTYFTATYTDNSYPFLYIAIGQQQWGLSTGRTITYPISLLVLYSIVALDAASGMDAVQVCDVNTADNTNAIIFQMRLTQGDILPDNMTGFYWILIGRVQQWGYYFESQSDTDYRYLPLTYTTHYCIALGNITYAPNELEGGFVPYYQEVSNSVFLVGLGNNRIGNAYVPVITVGI